MNVAVSVEGLRKSYGSRTVLGGVSFEVARGEIFALLGVNGAGKTTALECIENLRRCDGGSITVHGKTGIQLQSASLPAHIRPMEAVKLIAKWSKSPVSAAMLDALGIGELGKRNYVSLSTGQKRRLHLALALTGDPDILFLDEPTAGLDVEGRLSLHETIRGLQKKGKTVILSSHDMAEVESLCDRIAILSGGVIVFAGTVAELTERAGRRFVIGIKTAQGETSCETDDIAATLLELLKDYQSKGVAVLDIKVDRGSLEQNFIDVARGRDQ